MMKCVKFKDKLIIKKVKENYCENRIVEIRKI